MIDYYQNGKIMGKEKEKTAIEAILFRFFVTPTGWPSGAILKSK